MVGKRLLPMTTFTNPLVCPDAPQLAHSTRHFMPYSMPGSDCKAEVRRHRVRNSLRRANDRRVARVLQSPDANEICNKPRGDEFIESTHNCAVCRGACDINQDGTAICP